MEKSRLGWVSAACGLCGALLPLHATAQTTTVLVSVAANGTTPTAASSAPSVSADGRFVAFVSGATNIVTGDTNNQQDVFVRDTVLHTTLRASLADDGSQGLGASGDINDRHSVGISADGRYVAFSSFAANLVLLDKNRLPDVFVRDTLMGTTVRASLSSDGQESHGGQSFDPSISADGLKVAFQSNATDLVPGEANGIGDILLRDTSAGTTATVSIAADGTPSDAASASPGTSVDADGHHVAFWSAATTLVTPATDGTETAYYRDTVAGVTTLLGTGVAGPQANQSTVCTSLSADGRYVAYASGATTPGASGGGVFVRDMTAGTTQYADLAPGGAVPNALGTLPSISADGRYVAFTSTASNLVAGDTTGTLDVFVRDMTTGAIIRASLAYNGATPNADCGFAISLSGDGRYVAFRSSATNLIAGGTAATPQVYLRGPLFATGPYTQADVVKALQIAGGLAVPGFGDFSRLNLQSNGASPNRIDMADVVRVARKAAGKDPNP